MSLAVLQSIVFGIHRWVFDVQCYLRQNNTEQSLSRLLSGEHRISNLEDIIACSLQTAAC